jgi:Zn-dependent protease with chaperone function
MTNNFAEVHRVLTRQAGLLGFAKPPDMYIVSDPNPIIYSIPAGPGAIIISSGLREQLAEAEVEALLAHELTHIRCKHVRLELAMVFIRSTNPVVKVLLFPVLLMMLFARAWMELIDFTADRGALLVTLKPAVVNSAIVKLAVVSDPNAGITKAELEEFLSSTGEIQTDSQQLERHFKVGQLISSQPNLKERIEQLTDFPRGEQGKQAMAKMAQLQGVPVTSIPVIKPTRVEGVEQVIDDTEDSSPGL